MNEIESLLKSATEKAKLGLVRGLLFFMVFSGCGKDVQWSRSDEMLMNSALDSTCLGGVKYYVWRSSLSPALKTSGKPILCDIIQEVKQ